MKLSLWKILIVGVLWVSLVKTGSACLYGPPFATVCEKYATSDAIVVGRVTRARAGGLGQLVVLDVETTYKGSVSGAIQLDQPLSTCDWDFTDEVGSKLLLYLQKNNGKRSYHAIGTGFGGRVERQNGDLYWLNGLPKSLRRTRVSGTIKLYKDDPFQFLNPVSNMPLIISTGKSSYDLESDSNGVYQLWDVGFGSYKITARFPPVYSLDFSMALGNVNFRKVSDIEVDTEDFQVIITSEQKCGGSDYVLNRRK